MTQKDLAVASGLSKSYVSDLVRGVGGRRPGVDVAIRLGSVLQVDLGFFMPEKSTLADGESVARHR